jgi:hypothetical protein
VLKDIDFDNIEKSLAMEIMDKSNLFAMIKKDSKFLADHNLMDYSLLIMVY